MTAGNHDDVYFAARWRLKDARYGLALADDVGQATPLSALATELFRLAVARGLGDKNSSVVIETLR
jgi:3-hydroxyisobutyrate dehydrogenase-like beta-hydroxyacid dehydrogenase